MNSLQNELDHRALENFLFNEAKLLSDWKVEKWLENVTPDISYRVPVRSTLESPKEYEPGYSSTSFHLLEDYGTLKARVQRLATRSAWSETPPSRVRRHISCVQSLVAGDGEFHVSSNMLLFWGRDLESVIISGERQDVIRLVDGCLKLASRTLLLDHTVLPLPSIPFLL